MDVKFAVNIDHLLCRFEQISIVMYLVLKVVFKDRFDF